MEEKNTIDFYYDLTSECKQKLTSDTEISEGFKNLLIEDICEGIKFYDADNSKYYYVPIKFYSLANVLRIVGAVHNLKASYHEKNNIDVYINEQGHNPRYATLIASGFLASPRRTVSKKVATIMFDSMVEIREEDLLKLEKENFNKTHGHYLTIINSIFKSQMNTLLKHFNRVMADTK